MPVAATVKSNSQYFKEYSGKTIKLKLINSNETMYGRFMAVSSANQVKSYYKTQNDIIYFDRITNLDIHKNGSVLENYLNYGVITISENQIAHVEIWDEEI